MLAEYVSPAGRRARADEEGLTLVEIMIAAFMLAVAIMALASVATTSLVSVRDSRERDRATAAASSAIEAARGLPFESVAMGGTDWQTGDPAVQLVGGVWRFDHNADGDFGDSEPVYASAAGLVDPYICTSDSDDCWFDMPAGTRVEVRTYVSQYEDMAAGFARRVTVVAIWDDPSFPAPRIVRMSTVVSHADRGLPAPQFEVLPESLFTRVDQFFVTEPPLQWHCFQHVMTNLGVPDSYEIHLRASDGWLPVPTLFGDVEGQYYYQDSVDPKPWRFRAYFVPSGEDLSHPDHLMTAVPGDAERIISPTPLDTDESAQLHLCYRAREVGDPPELGSTYTFEHTVHSAFDAEIFRSVEHEIEVESLVRLHLHYGSYDLTDPEADPDDWEFEWEHFLDGQYTRPASNRVGGVFQFDQLPMLPGPPPDETLPHYDGFIRHNGTNYPHSSERLNRAGMFLPRQATTVDGVSHPHTAFAIEWDWQFNNDTAPITYAGGVDFRIWASRVPPGLADEIPDNALWCMRTELQRAQLVGGSLQPFTTVGAFDTSIDTEGGWRVVTFAIPWSETNVTFQPGDVLRFRLVSGGVDFNPNCTRYHVGFGVAEFAAALDFTPAD